MERGIRVRPASPGDATVLGRIDYDAWTARERRPRLESADVPFFERSHGGGLDNVLVATVPSAVAGFLVLLTDGGLSRVSELCVDRVFRRRRAATALLEAAAARTRDRGSSALYVRVPRTHDAARSLVRSVGFRVVESTRHRADVAPADTWALDVAGASRLQRRSPLP